MNLITLIGTGIGICIVTIMVLWAIWVLLKMFKWIMFFILGTILVIATIVGFIMFKEHLGLASIYSFGMGGFAFISFGYGSMLKENK